jgi:hypothetical protein
LPGAASRLARSLSTLRTVNCDFAFSQRNASLSFVAAAFYRIRSKFPHGEHDCVHAIVRNFCPCYVKSGRSPRLLRRPRASSEILVFLNPWHTEELALSLKAGSIDRSRSCIEYVSTNLVNCHKASGIFEDSERCIGIGARPFAGMLC